jgi:hypothetical protein
MSGRRPAVIRMRMSDDELDPATACDSSFVLRHSLDIRRAAFGILPSALALLSTAD